MNKKDPSFKELNNALQVRYRELRQSGIGAIVKHAPLITEEEESALLGSKVIGDHNPLALQRAVFYYVLQLPIPTATPTPRMGRRTTQGAM